MDQKSKGYGDVFEEVAAEQFVQVFGQVKVEQGCPSVVYWPGNEGRAVLGNLLILNVVIL